MKKILIFILLFSSVVKADTKPETPNWPSQLFSADKVYQSFLRPFQNYFRDINRDYVVYNLAPNLREITSSKYPQYYFKIFIQRTVAENTITEVINYSVRDYPSGRILIKRTGSNLIATSNEDLFSFKFPSPSSAEKFQLFFDDGSGIKMNFSNIDGKLAGTMALYKGSVIINFNETRRDDNFSTRSLWYICDNCDGSALLANAQKVAPGEWQYLYKTSNGSTLTSQDFYYIYSNYYSPPISNFFESTLKVIIDTYDWP